MDYLFMCTDFFPGFDSFYDPKHIFLMTQNVLLIHYILHIISILLVHACIIYSSEKVGNFKIKQLKSTKCLLDYNLP